MREISPHAEFLLMDLSAVLRAGGASFQSPMLPALDKQAL